MAGDCMRFDGTVLDGAHDTYRVEVEVAGQRRTVVCRRCGRMQSHRIRVVAGDSVTIEVGAYDLTKGRIVERTG